MKRDFDLVFDFLYKRNDIDRNTLFIFWDILRCMNGDFSCIDMHNIYASELMDKINEANSEQDTKGSKGLNYEEEE